jgi:mRNA interferase MazF
MPNYSRNDVVLIRYPFTDLTSSKVRPAVVAGTTSTSSDLLIVALTSKTTKLRSGEFVLSDWTAAGLHVQTAAKRSIFTIDERLVIQKLGQLSSADSDQLTHALREWLTIS